MAHVKICPTMISAVDMRALCATVTDSVQAFYKDPENQRRYEKWKCKKEENKTCLRSK